MLQEKKQDKKNKKVALVTGCSSGFGESFANALLDEGFEVCCTARRLDRMADLERRGALVIKADLSKPDDIASLVREVENSFGRLDVLINNAGYGMYGPFEECGIEAARAMFEVNLFGLADLTKRLVPLMRRQGEGQQGEGRQGEGRIINISSMGGKVYVPFSSWYFASKHALEGLSDCMRLELAPFNIDVVIIEPGSIATEFGSIYSEYVVQPESPYAARVSNALRTRLAWADAKKGKSSPQIVTDVVMKSIRAKRPRIRYAVGPLARPMITLRRLFGDRFFDFIMRRGFD